MEEIPRLHLDPPGSWSKGTTGSSLGRVLDFLPHNANVSMSMQICLYNGINLYVWSATVFVLFSAYIDIFLSRSVDIDLLCSLNFCRAFQRMNATEFFQLSFIGNNLLVSGTIIIIILLLQCLMSHFLDIFTYMYKSFS